MTDEEVRAPKTAPQASTLYLNGQPIWHNPAGTGHAFIKLRKDIHEEELIKRMWLRKCMRLLAEHPA